MKAVLIIVLSMLVAMVFTYLGAAFISWDLGWVPLSAYAREKSLVAMFIIWCTLAFPALLLNA